ncbi:hypothetical protein SAICODRAFT_8931 [Saitoella complicata NRRL Y-17804]|uniref:uncharacterized protein n=1 Tax=Saitoella complicata (strain BCRC 22490 / CBS 7301 / JCM 7358 / NBRC 10748 / NRRL Y-17804) TaxID=698492 RepID=UPI000866EF4C|nr:uncharacterized protein SAICODRAFT_8931 [Saitoella complicata NRRL Y-17804]ODQ51636.1 hypothetical protein SAICODRAFT_8931 [Saitoella complicata NRRL Y-17804]
MPTYEETLARMKRTLDNVDGDVDDQPDQLEEPAKKRGRPSDPSRAATSSRTKSATSTGGRKKKATPPPVDNRPILKQIDEIPLAGMSRSTTTATKLSFEHLGGADGPVNSNSLGTLLGYKGKTKGAANKCYYAGYVFCEKLRILQGKKKTKKRLDCEHELPTGYDYGEGSGRQSAYVFAGDTLAQDKWGRLEAVPKRGYGW